MTKTPPWWPHTVESWVEISDFFSPVEVSDAKNWEPLSHGQSNYSYKLSLPEGDLFFVQVINLRNLDLLPQSEHRVSLLELTNLTSIKQWLVGCYVDSLHLKISKWVCAPERSKMDLKLEPDFDDKDLTASLVRFLVALHSIDKNQIETIDLPSLDIQNHLQRYFEKVSLLELEDEFLFDLDLDRCLEISANFEASSICHNDLSRPNLLWDQQELKVIDWEYACISDPLFDLAGLIVNCRLNRSQERKFLNLYSTGLNRTVPHSKFSDMKRLYRTLNVLWFTLQKKI